MTTCRSCFQTRKSTRRWRYTTEFAYSQGPNLLVAIDLVETQKVATEVGPYGKRGPRKRHNPVSYLPREDATAWLVHSDDGRRGNRTSDRRLGPTPRARRRRLGCTARFHLQPILHLQKRSGYSWIQSALRDL